MPSSNSITMVKGTKRKIEIKKRETKQQRAVACSKRRQTVFSKAADLCLVSGANIAVFVTSPSDNSDAVYSFSGYSPASEIAHCYLNGKLPPNPQPKLGFWWEDPDLYRSCDDFSELNLIEDRLEKTKKELMACLAEKEKSLPVSDFHLNALDDQNPDSFMGEIYGDTFSSQVATFDPNLSSKTDEDDDYMINIDELFSEEEMKRLGFSDFHLNALDATCSPVASLDQNPNSYLDETYVETFDQKHGEASSSQVATSDPNVSSKTDDDDDYMVNIDELFSEEEMKLLGFCEN